MDASPPVLPSRHPRGDGLVDADGLRCEVLSMRAITHALYSTPRLAEVIDAYVRQLIDDFTRSLLLCRPPRPSAAVSTRASADPSQQPQPSPSTSASPTRASTHVPGSPFAYDDEGTYLLLQLCANEDATLQQQQQQQQQQTHRPSSAGSARADEAPATVADASASASPERTVTEQLVALLAAPATTPTPPLLSSLLRFQPMVRDMRYLATHLLLPRNAWQHYGRDWVLVHEDVSVTLRDRIARYRGRRAPRQPYPLTEVTELWHTLWELLGAAWRQRDRLWGAYRHVHGPHQLPPLCLCHQATAVLPPGVHACPIQRDHHTRYTAHQRAAAAASAAVPSATRAAEDTCGFGPFTCADVGVSAHRLFVLRQPLAAVLRSLRVSAPPAGRDALTTSTTAFAGFKYVSDVSRRGQAAAAAAVLSSPPPPPLVAPLFDSTDDDVRLSKAVPYMSPEVYVACRRRELQQQQQHGARCSAASVVHVVSDDVWNVAVVVLEVALSGFRVDDLAECHLAAPPLQPASTDDNNNDNSDAASLPLYASVLDLLTRRHRLPTAAAHNFLYAALHHLGAATATATAAARRDSETDTGDDDSNVSGGAEFNANANNSSSGGTASPARLAREWRRHLRRAYGPACLEDGGVLAEVLANGLRWRMSERWNAFCTAHAPVTSVAVGVDRTSPEQPYAALAMHPGTPRDDEERGVGSPQLSTRASATSRTPTTTTSASAAAMSPFASALVAATPTINVGRDDDDDDDGAAAAASPASLLSVHSPALSISSSVNNNNNGGGGGAAGVPARLPQRLDRLLGTLDTPLLRVLGHERRGCSTAADDAADVWRALAVYQRRRCGTVAGGRAPGTAATEPTEAAGSGADDVLQLLFHAQLRTTAVAAQSPYTAMHHAFFRGLAERGLLVAHMAVAGVRGGGGGGGGVAAPLPALHLYVPTAVLAAVLREANVTTRLDTGAAARQPRSLHTLIGDDARVWEVERAAAARGTRAHQQQQQQHSRLLYPFAGTPTSALPPPVHRARRAVSHVLSPLDLDVSAQLHHTRELRQRMLRSSSDAAAAAEQVRIYLTETWLPDTSCSTATSATAAAAARRTYSPLYAVPVTARAEVWRCLLGIAPSSRSRNALHANAVRASWAKVGPHDRQLAVDLPRCHAYHPLLSSSAGSAQLQRVLRAWLHLHPSTPYWQGLDSVCAVLLSVTDTDEALVLAQLCAIVDRYVAHGGEEDGDRRLRGGGGGNGGGGTATPTPPPSPRSPQLPPTTKPTMAEQLHRLTVVLRYCDPLLAHYLFDVIGCTPELYAISWILTLFAHSLPTRKVQLLWDQLFIAGDVECIVLLCVAVMMHKRERLLSADLSGCLAAFSSGAAAVNATAAVGDTRWLMPAVPPSVLAQPTAAAAAASMMDSRSGRRDTAAPAATVALLAVQDLVAALAVDSRKSSDGDDVPRHWSHSGVYLIDLRDETTTRDAVLGAVRVALLADDTDGGVDGGAQDGAAGAGWGLVEHQEAMQAQQQAAEDAAARRVDDAAVAVLRAVGNAAMAAVVPRVVSVAAGAASATTTAPPWRVHPIVWKTSQAPHVVLLTSGAPAAATVMRATTELALAHRLAVKLSACGVHNVSVLHGGVARLRRVLPELVVRRAVTGAESRA
ncbi:Rab-GTPase-TBC domain containing protein [Novymonas esmeraldas]|uniref:Rab-GTPase-TBC domain containing protein n=1 Tax=Novymonas esmeraldas TaxID=1808958 RepID=A0AAW0EL36_9TRYP